MFLGSIIALSAVLVITLIGIAFGYAMFTDEVANRPSSANAGILDASMSQDTAGRITSYLWEETNDFPLSLSSNDDARVTFRAPVDIENDTELASKLSVTDDKNQTSSDTVNIIIQNETEGALSCTPITTRSGGVENTLWLIAQNPTPAQNATPAIPDYILGCERTVEFPAYNTGIINLV